MFILQNQNGYFLAKSGEWIDGRQPQLLFRTLHKDEALNQLFEANSRDHALRINLMQCEISSKKLPIIPEALLPLPLIKENAEQTEEVSA
ncbi:MAG: hypothetical protein AAFZ92_02770 [Pseudomonadota bacterium]